MKGRQQRFVTHQEIEGALPPIEENLELIEEFVEILQNLGVEIVDQKKAIDWRKKVEEEEDRIDHQTVETFHKSGEKDQ